jgi:hypothetical protein
MSAQVQLVGQLLPGGGYSVAVTDAVSKPTVELVPWLWEVTAKPARSVPVRPVTDWVEPGTTVHVVPSADVYAV